MSIIPEYGRVSDEAYAEMGLRSGLEVHQQLLTECKLFCHCPAGLYSDEFDAQILRHMRPTLSELGEYDGTALMEFKTRKEIIYRLKHDRVCTYDMDDAPPFQVNENAVDIAIEIALLLNLQLIDEIHIARKQYLDGSIPTGFQRTTIFGVHGYLEYPGPLGGTAVHPDRRIRVRQLGMEEDSCREVSDVGHYRTYIADRLGTPLIEVVTEAEMRNPREVAEVGQHIRYLTRATKKVRRGLGGCRQDVNVSIEGGTRIEIKGVPRIPLIPRLVHYEAFRQKALLDVRDELRRRKVSPDAWHPIDRDITHLMRRATFAPVAEAVAAGKCVHAIRLPQFGQLLNHPTQPYTVLLDEFSDRVRVIACLQGEPNVIASDSPASTLAPGIWRRVLRSLRADTEDAVIVVWGDARDVETAREEIRLRAIDAMHGVPKETRQAREDGTNGFERILPGAERMYPDTDLPPKAITVERVERIRSQLPTPPVQRAQRMADLGVSDELRQALIRSDCMDTFDAVIDAVPNAPATLLAYTLACFLKHRRREGKPTDQLQTTALIDIFAAAVANHWPKEAVLDAIDKALASDGTIDAEQLQELVPAQVETEALTAAVQRQLQSVPFKPHRQRTGAPDRQSANTNGTTPAQRHKMGALMRSLRNRVHGAALIEVMESFAAGK